MKTVVENIGAGIVVKQCIPFRLNGATGYTLSFSDGTTATVYDGKDGTNGGVPVVSFASVDGVLCWTIDGNLLKDADGKPIPVKGAKGAPGADGKNGADADPNAGTATPGTPGKSPVLRISGGSWEWSTDGTNWAVLGPATGVRGQTGSQGSAGSDGAGSVSFFKSVTKSADGKKMTFELKDGTRYAVNIGKPSSYTVSADGETLTFQIGKASFEMALVKAGTFTMGDGTQKRLIVGIGTLIYNPTHQVKLTQDYYLMKELMDTTTAFELMNNEEKSTTYWSNKIIKKYVYFGGPSNAKIIDEPNFRRKWTYIDLITERLSEKTNIKFNLPTEAQWEYAAKGGHKSKGYKYFGTNNLNTILNCDLEENPMTNELGIKGMKAGQKFYGYREIPTPVKDGCDFGGYFSPISFGTYQGELIDPCTPLKGYGFILRQNTGEWQEDIYIDGYLNAYGRHTITSEYRTPWSESDYEIPIPCYYGYPRLIVYAEDLN